MRCSRCGRCCEDTEMELSSEDIRRLQEAGYRREDFAVTDDEGVTRLKNVGGWCYFYDSSMNKCKIYERRPLGCHLYPVVYSDNGVIIDELCPMGHTVSEQELKVKGKILEKLVKEIYNS